MTSMVEKVSEAIDRVIRIDAGFDIINPEDVARAAIDALKEPTDAVIEAACRASLPATFKHGLHGLPTDGPGTRRDMAAVEAHERKRWRAMIDAALSEP